MDLNRLKFQHKKAKEAFEQQQTNANVSQTELSLAETDSKTLQNEQKNINDSIKNLEASISEFKEKNRVLSEFKRTLCQELDTLKQGISDQNKLKTDVVTLEEQVAQLQQEFDEEKVLIIQYQNENVVLKDCIINANSKLEEKTHQIIQLQKQLNDAPQKIDDLTANVNSCTQELDCNYRDPSELQEAIQKKHALTTEKNQLSLRLIDAFQLNDELETKTNKIQNELSVLQDIFIKSTTGVEELEAIKSQNSTKIESVSTKLAEQETKLREITDDRDQLIIQNDCLTKHATKLDSELKNINQAYRLITEKLLQGLVKKTQLEEELKTKTNNDSDTFENLKTALLTCFITTQKSYEQLKEHQTYKNDFEDLQEDVKEN